MNIRPIVLGITSILSAGTCIAGDTAKMYDFNMADHSAICTLGLRSPSPGTAPKVWVPKGREPAQVVKWISDITGIQPNFTILAGKFDKKVWAFATIRDGKRYIVYDADEFDWNDDVVSWTDAAVIAHEIGHHLANHMGLNGDRHAEELEADRFSGATMYKLGATLEQALRWTEKVSASDSKTHPARHRRVAAVTEGWELAEKLSAAQTGHCKNRWLSEPFKETSGETCRIALRCHALFQPIVKACQDTNGQWQWGPSASR